MTSPLDNSKSVTYTGKSPLLNFGSGKPTLKLSDGVCIYRATEKEIGTLAERAIGALENAPLTWAFGAEKPRFVLQTTCSATDGGLDADPVYRRTYQVITALRLFSNGGVGIPWIDVGIKRGDIEKPGLLMYSWDPELGIRPFEDTYYLREDQVNQVVSFWRAVEPYLAASVTAARPDTWLAITRFNSAYSRHGREDQLLDLMIGFEALLLRERDELAYRLSTRVAMLLGESDEEAQAIARDIREAYKARSRIVHGADIPDIVVDGYVSSPLDDVVYRIHRLLARAINAVFALSEELSRDQLINRLDESLLSQQLRAWFRTRSDLARGSIQT